MNKNDQEKKEKDCCVELVKCCCCLKFPWCRYIVLHAIPIVAFIILLFLRIFLDPSHPSRPEWTFVLIPLEFLFNLFALTIFLNAMDYSFDRKTAGNPLADDPKACRTCACITFGGFGSLLIGWGLNVLGLYLTDSSFFLLVVWEMILWSLAFNIISLIIALIPAGACYLVSACEGK